MQRVRNRFRDFYDFYLLTYPSFGFAKYHHVRDSELCIRGFYKLGYEVGFARVSSIHFSRFSPLIHVGIVQFSSQG
jgi:hypothetical protein